MKDEESIEVERVFLDGIVESIEPLSDGWHQRFSRGETMYEIIIKYENPLNRNKPITVKEWPVRKEILDEVKTGDVNRKIPFGVFNGEVYKFQTFPSCHGSKTVLLGVSDGAECTVEVDKATLKFWGREVNEYFNPYYEPGTGVYLGDD